MNVSVLARLASLLLVVALLLPAAAAVASPFGRVQKSRLHRPVYKKYQPGCRWIFQK
ncbi:hypothetical protein [Hymenobacter busanensis]|uniref:hypothetical protein n=1 Tax=Hymenobacter busanensis TaxID=2607656 RepID=UPI00136720F6|nr:hypothetical protein [Hymenobacter busanensis]QHJ08808.1 hypothetical protein GUY19_16540 [Hymenobacter busanensis]